MRIVINDRKIVFPSSLAEITLGQRIDFYNQFGKDLDERALQISKMDDSTDKEMAIIEFHFDKMLRTFSFFSDISVEAIRESDSVIIETVANIYHSCLQQLLEDESEFELQTEYSWHSEVWELCNPELKNGSGMTFGELIDAKQAVQNMTELGKGRWEAMLYLCAIFLRKRGESYQEGFLFENSDRLKLMRDLPLNIAMAVGFFLSSSLNIYMNSSPSFNHQQSEVPTKTVNDISSVGGGLIS